MTLFSTPNLGMRWCSRVFSEQPLCLPQPLPTPAALRVDSVTLAGLRPRHLIGTMDGEAAAQRLSRVDVRLLVAELDGEVVGSAWLETALAEIGDLDHQERLPTGTAWLSGLEIVAASRRRGAARALLTHAGNLASEFGKTRLVAACAPEHGAAEDLLIGAGFQPYRKVDYRRIGRLRFYRAENFSDGERLSWLSLGDCSLAVF